MDIHEQCLRAGVISPTFEPCPDATHYEAYDWCKLSGNRCLRHTGNADFDRHCDWYDQFLKEAQ